MIMKEIPKGTPALMKYLPFTYEMPDAVRAEYFEACVQHGMKYGKLRAEAERTENRCIEMIMTLNELAPDKQRETIFEIQTAYAESSKSRHLWKQYCVGNGCEIASGGWPLMPNAIQVELDKATYAHYNSGNQPEIPIQYHRHPSAGFALPFKDESLDWIGNSHYAEDVPRHQWPTMMLEWKRVLKKGGHIVMLVPELERWNYATKVMGQCDNSAHQKPEPSLGDMSKAAKSIGLEVVVEALTETYPGDYTIYGVFRV